MAAGEESSRLAWEGRVGQMCSRVERPAGYSSGYLSELCAHHCDVSIGVRCGCHCRLAMPDAINYLGIRLDLVVEPSLDPTGRW
jgi:hypothetical protein